ncbi:hypothetical protein Pan258_56950 [Symmachiella dynata]|nr:hypothetical protein Pan258_56950 [Symmachiella dynata]
MTVFCLIVADLWQELAACCLQARGRITQEKRDNAENSIYNGATQVLGRNFAACRYWTGTSSNISELPEP